MLDDDPEGIVFQHVRTRLAELEDERREKVRTLHELEASTSQTPDSEAVDLLDGLLWEKAGSCPPPKTSFGSFSTP
jgi:hypothetical protein